MAAVCSQLTIEVARDEEGLRLALLDRCERELKARAEEALGGKAEERPLKFADGYYRWAQHLMELESEAALLRPSRLQAVELRGLVMLAAARAQFQAEHPECPHCGANLLAPTDTICWHCRQTWEKK